MVWPSTLQQTSKDGPEAQNTVTRNVVGLLKSTTVINPASVRSWLRKCEEHHGRQCNGKPLGSSNEPIDDMVLIDVVNNKLVDGTNIERYVALSYVWGGWGGANVFLGSTHSHHVVMRTGEFPLGAFQLQDKRLPKTIKQAMDLTRSIGEKYLWCDALCVTQEESEASNRVRVRQISQMDKIYSRAVFTIVVLSGKHGDEMIPGVQRGSRQPIVTVSRPDVGLAFIARTPDVGLLAKDTVYQSRAWTFQEQLLSRRCLFITESQVYFNCTVGCFREDEDVFSRLTSTSLPPQPTVSASTLWPMLQNSDPVQLYYKIVTDYTTRKLTKHTDVLNAFQGISKVLEKHHRTGYSLGIPLRYFNQALLFIPSSRICKRNYLPSWTWAAYTGQVCFEWPFSTSSQTRSGKMHVLQSLIQNFAYEHLDESELQSHLTNHYILYTSEEFLPPFTHLRQGRYLSYLFMQYILMLFYALKARLRALAPHLHGSNTLESWQAEFAGDGFSRYSRIFDNAPLTRGPTAYELADFYANFAFAAPSVLSTGYPKAQTKLLEKWPFNSIAQGAAREITGRDSSSTADHESLPWCSDWVPTRIELQEDLAKPKLFAKHLSLFFWAHTIAFDAKCIQGGQLYRSGFSSSSLYTTTRDGRIQCTIETLAFSEHGGITPGIEIQPASIMYNVDGQLEFLDGTARHFCGIVLDNEEDCVSRIAYESCRLILLSKTLMDDEELWQNCMVVAKSRSDSRFWRRIAIARLIPGINWVTAPTAEFMHISLV
ncbi:heterokaryon incompatibility protein-domain-containing protein [Lophiotrema nucula]|uniref:Heterokaryon incompatibility protein-domain-containing protein n=1 Tax=Lophiotrema nucula TaxID=690887 RepID=A0A6A5ZF19_9PLEO|nr:heterokaryon incompatibility protein-domain-containing protein [Lophiotrema nucula]